MNDDEMLEIFAEWADQNRTVIATRYELELTTEAAGTPLSPSWTCSPCQRDQMSSISICCLLQIQGGPPVRRRQVPSS